VVVQEGGGELGMFPWAGRSDIKAQDAEEKLRVMHRKDRSQEELKGKGGYDLHNHKNIGAHCKKVKRIHGRKVSRKKRGYTYILGQKREIRQEMVYQTLNIKP